MRAAIGQYLHPPSCIVPGRHTITQRSVGNRRRTPRHASAFGPDPTPHPFFMRATSSWCKPLLHHSASPPTRFRTCNSLRPALNATRGIGFTAVRSAARRTPATAPEVPADVKGKGKETAEPDTAGKLVDGLPFLPRPLGVHERPTTVGRSWREDMMDQETRMDHRKKL